MITSIIDGYGVKHMLEGHETRAVKGDNVKVRKVEGREFETARSTKN